MVVAALATTLTTALPAGAGAPRINAAVSASDAPYIVVMDSAPVLGNEALAPDPGDRPDPDSAPVEAYVGELEEQKDRALESAGVDESAVVAEFTYAANGFTAALTKAEAETLRAQKGVAAVIPDHLRQLTTDNSPSFLGLTDRGGAYASGYTGKGVIVGVIDSGIWPEHPSFADSGLGAPPADWMGGSPVCEFGDTAFNPEDLPFDCNHKLIGARNMKAIYQAFEDPETYSTARDYDGHGTHTASTAAGNRNVRAQIFGNRFGKISGIAPDAWVAAYAACGNLGCYGGDLADAIDQAVEDGVDVINYSIGSDTPGLDGIDDISFLFAADAGVFVATSAGNAGPGASTIGSPSASPWVVTVGASEQDRTFESVIKVDLGKKSRWSHFSKKQSGVFEGASVTKGLSRYRPFVDGAALGNEFCDPAVDFTADITGKVVLCLRGVVDRIEKSLAVYEQGGAGMVLYNPSDAMSLMTDNHWVPSVMVDFSDGSALKAYIAAKGTKAKIQFGAPDKEHQRGNRMADFSSRGPVGNPASADIIKPDVTAPGVQILAGNTPTPAAGSPGQLFQAIAGTSMSSPHVAGLLALIKQAHPDWSPAMAKSALMTTARQDIRKEDGRTKADPFDFGAGHVDPSGKAGQEGSVFNPGLVYDTGTVDYVAFLCDTPASWLVTPLVGVDCGFLAGLGFQTQAENLNYPSIGVSEVAGTKTIVRTVTSVSNQTRTYKAKISKPRGYDVTVSPNQITLAPGESAAFEITFTNTGAPVGAWRFGSLTWRSGKNEVRSPIAVNAAAIEVPAAVSGTGTDGTLSFDVAFGYTGAYEAQAHGLAANSPLVGTVGQDPDQDFDPSDDGNGATANELIVTDASFLRITLGTDDLVPADPNIDLDLYLYLGDQLVAISGAGGTDELIELEAPENGTYTLYVHGWGIPGSGTVDYSVNTWAVPSAAGGGSLSILSAPTEATLSSTGTVEIGWAGLDAGATYLGAVTHHDGSGQVGMTLVNVES